MQDNTLYISFKTENHRNTNAQVDEYVVVCTEKSCCFHQPTTAQRGEKNKEAEETFSIPSKFSVFCI